jgi:hypothetical protein
MRLSNFDQSEVTQQMVLVRERHGASTRELNAGYAMAPVSDDQHEHVRQCMVMSHAWT